MKFGIDDGLFLQCDSVSLAGRSMSSADAVDGAWVTIRHLIGREVLNNGLIPVPSLSAADHFGLFSVFVKSKCVKLNLFTVCLFV